MKARAGVAFDGGFDLGQVNDGRLPDAAFEHAHAGFDFGSFVGREPGPSAHHFLTVPRHWQERGRPVVVARAGASKTRPPRRV